MAVSPSFAKATENHATASPVPQGANLNSAKLQGFALESGKAETMYFKTVGAVAVSGPY